MGHACHLPTCSLHACMQVVGRQVQHAEPAKYPNILMVDSKFDDWTGNTTKDTLSHIEANTDG